MVAAAAGHTDVAASLLEAGADLMACCNEGQTALHKCVWRHGPPALPTLTPRRTHHAGPLPRGASSSWRCCWTWGRRWMRRIEVCAALRARCTHVPGIERPLTWTLHARHRTVAGPLCVPVRRRGHAVALCGGERPARLLRSAPPPRCERRHPGRAPAHACHVCEWAARVSTRRGGQVGLSMLPRPAIRRLGRGSAGGAANSGGE